VSAPRSPSSPRFEPLAWDTAPFAMAVNRIAGVVREGTERAPLLAQARAADAKLVYYLPVRPFSLTTELLERYGGERVAGDLRLARACRLCRRAGCAPAVEGAYDRLAAC